MRLFCSWLKLSSCLNSSRKSAELHNGGDYIYLPRAFPVLLCLPASIRYTHLVHSLMCALFVKQWVPFSFLLLSSVTFSCVPPLICCSTHKPVCHPTGFRRLPSPLRPRQAFNTRISSSVTPYIPLGVLACVCQCRSRWVPGEFLAMFSIICCGQLHTFHACTFTCTLSQCTLHFTIFDSVGSFLGSAFLAYSLWILLRIARVFTMSCPSCFLRNIELYKKRILKKKSDANDNR